MKKYLNVNTLILTLVFGIVIFAIYGGWVAYQVNK